MPTDSQSASNTIAASCWTGVGWIRNVKLPSQVPSAIVSAMSSLARSGSYAGPSAPVKYGDPSGMTAEVGFGPTPPCTRS